MPVSLQLVDASADDWFYYEVAYTYENRISNTKFGSDSAVIREKITALLYRYADFAVYGVSIGERMFPRSAACGRDDAVVSRECLITGRSSPTPASTGTAARTEMQPILMQFCEHAAPRWTL